MFLNGNQCRNRLVVVRKLWAECVKSYSSFSVGVSDFTDGCEWVTRWVSVQTFCKLGLGCNFRWGIRVSRLIWSQSRCRWAQKLFVLVKRHFRAPVHLAPSNLIFKRGSVGDLCSYTLCTPTLWVWNRSDLCATHHPPWKVGKYIKVRNSHPHPEPISSKLTSYIHLVSANSEPKEFLESVWYSFGKSTLTIGETASPNCFLRFTHPKQCVFPMPPTF